MLNILDIIIIVGHPFLSSQVFFRDESACSLDVTIDGARATCKSGDLSTVPCGNLLFHVW